MLLVEKVVDTPPSAQTLLGRSESRLGGPAKDTRGQQKDEVKVRLVRLHVLPCFLLGGDLGVLIRKWQSLDAVFERDAVEVLLGERLIALQVGGKAHHGHDTPRDNDSCNRPGRCGGVEDVLVDLPRRLDHRLQKITTAQRCCHVDDG